MSCILYCNLALALSVGMCAFSHHLYLCVHNGLDNFSWFMLHVFYVSLSTSNMHVFMHMQAWISKQIENCCLFTYTSTCMRRFNLWLDAGHLTKRVILASSRPSFGWNSARDLDSFWFLFDNRFLGSSRSHDVRYPGACVSYVCVCVCVKIWHFYHLHVSMSSQYYHVGVLLS